jgi:hypothetical protein
MAKLCNLVKVVQAKESSSVCCIITYPEFPDFLSGKWGAQLPLLPLCRRAIHHPPVATMNHHFQRCSQRALFFLPFIIEHHARELNQQQLAINAIRRVGGY